MRRRLALDRDILVAPLAAGGLVAALYAGPGPLDDGVPAGLAFLAGPLLSRRLAPHAALLPLMRVAFPLVGPLLGVALLVLACQVMAVPCARPLDLLATALAAALVAAPWPDRLDRSPARPTRRAAFIGRSRSADRLADALALSSSSAYELIGLIACPSEARNRARARTPTLGPLRALDALVLEHDVDVLILDAEAPRRAVFAEVTQSCLELPVRVVELSELYEEVFGHVPMAAIGTEWFACLAEPDVRVSVGPLKRAVDITGAVVIGLATLPLLALLALLVRSDGGPALFAQRRIGEGGMPFSLLKLRTMHVGAGASAQWAELDDPRVTRAGRFLRNTHLDELPQLVNVLRGEMTLVGPRPEQPAFVERLERALPLYRRRHLMRPGITGWAQVRCGYARSDLSSAWKLSHDLYYIKHRSVGLDLLILCETLATLVLPREPVIEPETVAFIVGEPDEPQLAQA